jgi:hypothetical protein
MRTQPQIEEASSEDGDVSDDHEVQDSSESSSSNLDV